jgi:hypothetical protein
MSARRENNLHQPDLGVKQALVLNPRQNARRSRAVSFLVQFLGKMADKVADKVPGMHSRGDREGEEGGGYGGNQVRPTAGRTVMGMAAKQNAANAM